MAILIEDIYRSILLLKLEFVGLMVNLPKNMALLCVSLCLPCILTSLRISQSFQPYGNQEDCLLEASQSTLFNLIEVEFSLELPSTKGSADAALVGAMLGFLIGIILLLCGYIVFSAILQKTHSECLVIVRLT